MASNIPHTLSDDEKCYHITTLYDRGQIKFDRKRRPPRSILPRIFSDNFEPVVKMRRYREADSLVALGMISNSFNDNDLCQYPASDEDNITGNYKVSPENLPEIMTGFFPCKNTFEDADMSFDLPDIGGFSSIETYLFHDDKVREEMRKRMSRKQELEALGVPSAPEVQITQSKESNTTHYAQTGHSKSVPNPARKHKILYLRHDTRRDKPDWNVSPKLGHQESGRNSSTGPHLSQGAISTTISSATLSSETDKQNANNGGPKPRDSQTQSNLELTGPSSMTVPDNLNNLDTTISTNNLNSDFSIDGETVPVLKSSFSRTVRTSEFNEIGNAKIVFKNRHQSANFVQSGDEQTRKSNGRQLKPSSVSPMRLPGSQEDALKDTCQIPITEINGKQTDNSDAEQLDESITHLVEMVVSPQIEKLCSENQEDILSETHSVSAKDDNTDQAQMIDYNLPKDTSTGTPLIQRKEDKQVYDNQLSPKDSDRHILRPAHMLSSYNNNAGTGDFPVPGSCHVLSTSLKENVFPIDDDQNSTGLPSATSTHSLKLHTTLLEPNAVDVSETVPIKKPKLNVRTKKKTSEHKSTARNKLRECYKRAVEGKPRIPKAKIQVIRSDSGDIITRIYSCSDEMVQISHLEQSENTRKSHRKCRNCKRVKNKRRSPKAVGKSLPYDGTLKPVIRPMRSTSYFWRQRKIQSLLARKHRSKSRHKKKQVPFQNMARSPMNLSEPLDDRNSQVNTFQGSGAIVQHSSCLLSEPMNKDKAAISPSLHTKHISFNSHSTNNSTSADSYDSHSTGKSSPSNPLDCKLTDKSSPHVSQFNIDKQPDFNGVALENKEYRSDVEPVVTEGLHENEVLSLKVQNSNIHQQNVEEESRNAKANKTRCVLDQDKTETDNAGGIINQQNREQNGSRNEVNIQPLYNSYMVNKNKNGVEKQSDKQNENTTDSENLFDGSTENQSNGTKQSTSVNRTDDHDVQMSLQTGTLDLTSVAKTSAQQSCSLSTVKANICYTKHFDIQTHAQRPYPAHWKSPQKFSHTEENPVGLLTQSPYTAVHHTPYSQIAKAEKLIERNLGSPPPAHKNYISQQSPELVKLITGTTLQTSNQYSPTKNYSKNTIMVDLTEEAEKAGSNGSEDVITIDLTESDKNCADQNRTVQTNTNEPDKINNSEVESISAMPPTCQDVATEIQSSQISHQGNKEISNVIQNSAQTGSQTENNPLHSYTMALPSTHLQPTTTSSIPTKLSSDMSVVNVSGVPGHIAFVSTHHCAMQPNLHEVLKYPPPAYTQAGNCAVDRQNGVLNHGYFQAPVPATNTERLYTVGRESERTHHEKVQSSVPLPHTQRIQASKSNIPKSHENSTEVPNTYPYQNMQNRDNIFPPYSNNNTCTLQTKLPLPVCTNDEALTTQTRQQSANIRMTVFDKIRQKHMSLKLSLPVDERQESIDSANTTLNVVTGPGVIKFQMTDNPRSKQAMNGGEEINFLRGKSNGKRSPKCNSCGKLKPSFLCSACQNVWFCDKACQVSAWKKHRKDCSKR